MRDKKKKKKNNTQKEQKKNKKKKKTPFHPNEKSTSEQNRFAREHVGSGSDRSDTNRRGAHRYEIALVGVSFPTPKGDSRAPCSPSSKSWLIVSNGLNRIALSLRRGELDCRRLLFTSDLDPTQLPYEPHLSSHQDPLEWAQAGAAIFQSSRLRIILHNGSLAR